VCIQPFEAREFFDNAHRLRDGGLVHFDDARAALELIRTES
jgi:hypothetical protein